jgi:phosphatidylserine/phosphatidylglycerophosphate/cardiolipin synthase-like enzyme
MDDAMVSPRRLPIHGRSHIEVYWTKGHTKTDVPATADPLEGLVNALGKARHEIVFGIFSFTAAPISAVLVEKLTKDVSIRGVADVNAAKSPTSKVALLRNAGVDIKLVGTRYALMHLKVAVIDGLRTAYGSYNWTTAAERSNDEILTVVTNRQLASVCIAQIDAIRAHAA